MSLKSEVRRAVKVASDAAQELWKFTDKLVPPYGLIEDAEKRGDKLLKELPHAEQCRYIGLWNRYAQAYNAWARLTGDRRRYRSMNRRRMVAVIRPGPRLMLPMPQAGPIGGRPRRESVYSGINGESGSGYLGPNEVEVCLPNGGRRIAMYDTEAHVEPTPGQTPIKKTDYAFRDTPQVGQSLKPRTWRRQSR